ncbi:hypothetical protein Krac_1756 [Ktedonobacter racemifer DSM 44963]|uniref:Uncharacterized protein n=1 Tax=Ktedonobacter racemifer DSM 44963 TaxID=485913 RepID=D6U377_KTERA|nr:hypothetical protein Krac_1756 [Ktedonobacter racemifer DSM 44963]
MFCIFSTWTTLMYTSNLLSFNFLQHYRICHSSTPTPLTFVLQVTWKHWLQSN